MVRRLVARRVLPASPTAASSTSATFGDGIPPHVDHHDFLRPLCTVSFLAEQQQQTRDRS
jgi:alkylated DNA repair protein alkB family protein 5